jgi:hypothetical protein
VEEDFFDTLATTRAKDPKPAPSPAVTRSVPAAAPKPAPEPEPPVAAPGPVILPIRVKTFLEANGLAQ